MHDVIAARKIMLPAVPFATRGARGDRQRMTPLHSSGLSPASDKVCTVVGTAKPNAAASPRSFDDAMLG
jgi:hypothetical protein